jgi:hypothetical protein
MPDQLRMVEAFWLVADSKEPTEVSRSLAEAALDGPVVAMAQVITFDLLLLYEKTKSRRKNK